MKNTKTLYGLYNDDDVLMDGIHHLQEKGVKIKDVYTPFPVHGLDHALGLKKTRLSDLAFCYGVFGLCLSIFMTWYIMTYDWSQDIGGKPSVHPEGSIQAWFRNMPAFVPVMFELTVFCAAHLMCLTYLFRNKLFPGAKPQNPDVRTTDDMFMVEINVEDNQEEIIQVLKDSGVVEISTK
ncbi:MAG: DUF3341 domain-containing protein [Flavobacteriales bacterium]